MIPAQPEKIVTNHHASMDPRFTELLHNFLQANVLDFIIKYHPLPKAITLKYYGFTHLLQACNKEPLDISYCKETMVEFHHLLVTTHLAFNDSLKVLVKSSNSKLNLPGALTKGLSEAMTCVGFVARVLHVILHSSTFASHLQVLNACKSLSLPLLDSCP